MFTSSIVLNEWRHYVIYDGTKQIIYENGVKIDENTITLSLNTQQRFTIGAKFDNTRPFNGRLYDFRYYNRAITETEIKKIVNTAELLGDEVITMPMSTVHPENLLTRQKIYPSITNGVTNNGVTTTSMKVSHRMVRRSPYVFKDSSHNIVVDNWFSNYSLNGASYDYAQHNRPYIYPSYSIDYNGPTSNNFRALRLYYDYSSGEETFAINTANLGEIKKNRLQIFR